MSVMNKERIKQRFKKARHTYEQNAVVQAHMARRLVALLYHTTGNHFFRVLEIGCGTGLLTRTLIQSSRIEQFFINDLVEECNPAASLAAPVQFIAGDAENTLVFPTKLNLIISNATFQWIYDFNTFLKKLSTLLMPDGILAFSSFGPDNFKELHTLLNISFPYLSLAELEAHASCCFHIIQKQEDHILLQFPDAKAVLKHMQTIGVNSLVPWAWSKSSLTELIQQYQQQYPYNSGVALTYHPLYFVLRKKETCQ